MKLPCKLRRFTLSERSESKGQALLVILLIMAVVLTIGLAITSRTVTDIEISEQTEEAARAFSAAEAGIEEALYTPGEDYFEETLEEGVTYKTQKSGLGEESSYLFSQPKEVNTLWLAEYPDYSSPYTASSLTLLWGDPSLTTTEEPALEATVYYKTAGGESKVIRYALDPNPSSRDHINNFCPPSGGSASFLNREGSPVASGQVSLAENLSFISALIFKKALAQTSPPSCDYTIGAGVDTADGNGNYSSVQPGDVVCISAGTRGPLTLRNFKGTAGQPIIFVNSGGLVRVDAGGDWAGILIQNSEHFRLTGTGDSGIEYGFEIYNSTNKGVTAINQSRYLEIDHIEVHDVDSQAISAKTDEALRGIWVQYDTYVHHCYIHDVGKEGFYIGSAHYDEGIRPTLEGAEIAYNIIERTGWDGGHVSSCVSDCSIHHNYVYQDSRLDEPSQRSGLANAKGSVCDFYSNIIKNSGRMAIRIEPSGSNKVYNNIIIDPGDFAQPGSNDTGDGIKVLGGIDPYSDILIWNNTIIGPTNFGVIVDSDLVGENNAVQNNIIVNPGNLSVYGDIAYVNSGSNVLVSHNLKTPDINTVRFTDYLSDNYSLLSDSPAIDAGINVGISEDYDGNFRPQGAGYDIGAFEYGGVSSTPTPTPTSVFPPASPDACAGVTCPDDGRIGFCSSPSGYSIGGRRAKYKATIDLSLASGGTLLFVRLRFLYSNNESSQVLGAQAATGNFPSQGVKIESVGTAGTSTRRVEVTRLHPAPPEIFDFLIYSESDL